MLMTDDRLGTKAGFHLLCLGVVLSCLAPRMQSCLFERLVYRTKTRQQQKIQKGTRVRFCTGPIAVRPYLGARVTLGEHSSLMDAHT